MDESIELLAPAGSPIALKEAISAGADAVYLSGKKFGARQFADNFTTEEIEEATKYAHLRGVKVYITVNTLLKGRELFSAAEYIHKLYKIGVDAILVQDLGLAFLINQIFPDLVMHASTQMTIHNIDSLKWLEDNGFKRVVLSRELHLDEINSMSENSNLELEIFLHGALCYSYSGQCLLSSFIGGRSGNRGMCAQPCRKPYTLVYGVKDEYERPINLKELPLKEKYILSPKDLCLYNHLNELVDSEISSLKIEGRMRSPEYVKTVVSVYRQALDNLTGRKKFKDPRAVETLKLVFNRGFTSGHLYKSKGKKLMGRDKPGHRGLFIGHLKKYNPKKREGIIQLKSHVKIEKGDGIYVVPSKNDKSSAIGMDIEKEPKIKGNDIILSLKKPVTTPSHVFLTRKKNLSTIAPQRQKLDSQQLKVDFFFKVDEENYPHLEGIIQTHDGSILKSEVVGKTSMEVAKTRPLKKEDIEKQLLKMGGKSLKGQISDINYNENLFLPLRELNQLRRDLIDDLEKKIVQNYIPSPAKIESSQKKLAELKKNLHYTPKQTPGIIESIPSSNDQIKLSVYVNDIPSLKSAMKTGFNRIYLDMPLIQPENLFLKCDESSTPNYDRNYVEQFLKEALELCSNYNSHLIWKWPNITKEHMLNFLKMVKKDHPSNLDLMVGNPGVGSFIKKQFSETEVYGSSALNVWNHLTIAHVAPIFSLVTLSPELSSKDIKHICHYQNLQRSDTNRPQIEVIVQGSMESIISEDYILSPDLIPKTELSRLNIDKKALNEFWGLEDELNHIFPLNISSDCQSIILNSVETCLVDQIPFLIRHGVENIAIDGRWRGKQYVKDMGKLYQNAVKSSISQNNKKLEKIKKDIKKRSLGGITSFNFMRGVEKI